MNENIRFFISFSSRDLKYVREIMAALNGQGIEFWDYSDEIQSIELGEKISDRLFHEIDICSYMIVIISSNTLDPSIGKWCKLELDYAISKAFDEKGKIIPVIIKENEDLLQTSPYDRFTGNLYFDFNNSIKSIVEFTVKICKLLKRQYIPPVESHSKLPFRKLFRTEVEEMAHKNKDHVDLMIILGKFNEQYKRSNLEQAMFLINFFIDSCIYQEIPYQPFYPYIVKAVCETELDLLNKALETYSFAEKIQPENQDAIGGKGTVFFKMQKYDKAARCFEQIINNPVEENKDNARINLIITRQMMNTPISEEEEFFLFNTNIETYPEDLQTNILNAQCMQHGLKKRYQKLEELCRQMISKNLHDTTTVRMLQISYINRGMKENAKRIILESIAEARTNPNLDIDLLSTFGND